MSRRSCQFDCFESLEGWRYWLKVPVRTGFRDVVVVRSEAVGGWPHGWISQHENAQSGLRLV